MDEHFVHVESFHLSARKLWFYKAWKIILSNRYGDTVSLHGWFSAVTSLEALNC